MTSESSLLSRSESKCELCGTAEGLSVYRVPPDSDGTAEQSILACGVCLEQIEHAAIVDANHWRCLNDSMWSQVPAVQVVVWRMLTRLSSEGWPQELLDMIYLDEETLAWAQAGVEDTSAESTTSEHKDCHGAELVAGDTVTLIKDLTVKGAGFTAKRGTAVRGISLVSTNSEHIEGRVNGQQIVILTKFVKKSG